MVRIGLISDTHGLLRSEVFEPFSGVDLILHAGDIGGLDLLTELEAIAPVAAVHGNTDDFEVRARAPQVAHLEVAGKAIVLLHGDEFGSPRPAILRAAYTDADIIVYGHTHRPLLDLGDGGAIVINPGAAGPRRFDLQPTIGLLSIGDNGEVEAEIIEI